MPASPPPPYEERQPPSRSYSSSRRNENNNNVVIINIRNLVVNPGEISHAITMAELEQWSEATASSQRCAYPYCRNFISTADIQANRSSCFQHSRHFSAIQNDQIKMDEERDNKPYKKFVCVFLTIIFVFGIIAFINKLSNTSYYG